MKRLLSAIVFLFLSSARSQSFDSLLVVAAALKHDTDRVNLFYSEGFSKRAADPQFAYHCARRAEQIAQKLSLPFFIAKASNLLGVLYYRKSDFSAALSYHRKALNLRTIIGDKRGIAISNSNLGNIYSDLGKFFLAEEAYLEALKKFTEIGDQKQVDNCLLNLGAMYAQQQKDDLARHYFGLAIENATARNDYELQASGLNNLAVININSGRYEEAIANSMNSLKLKEIMENEMEKADSYLNLAVAHYKLNRKNVSRDFLLRADSIIQAFDYTSARLHSLKLKSAQAQEEKDFEKALLLHLAYDKLNDSLRQVNEQVRLSNSFAEYLGNKELREARPFEFPSAYLNLLLLTALGSGLLLFYHKR